MKKTGNLVIQIQSQEAKVQCEAELFTYTPSDALKRAALALLGSLGLLIVCIPIPIVHFIAVPACLLGGPLFAGLIFKMFVNQEEFRISKSQCPKCKAPLQLATTPSLWPIRDRCSECNCSYQAEVLSKASDVKET